MTTLSPLAKRRLRDAEHRFWDFRYYYEAETACSELRLQFSTDPSDCLGLAKVWGFTTETLIGAAFFYIWSWHDARQKYFDMPIREADALALKWARFTAENWPDETERRTLIRVVRYLGWVIPVYGTVRWKWIGGKE